MVTQPLIEVNYPIDYLKVYILAYSKRYFDELKRSSNGQKNEFLHCSDFRAPQCSKCQLLHANHFLCFFSAIAKAYSQKYREKVDVRRFREVSKIHPI